MLEYNWKKKVHLKFKVHCYQNIMQLSKILYFRGCPKLKECDLKLA